MKNLCEHIFSLCFIILRFYISTRPTSLLALCVDWLVVLWIIVPVCPFSNICVHLYSIYNSCTKFILVKSIISIFWWQWETMVPLSCDFCEINDDFLKIVFMEGIKKLPKMVLHTEASIYHNTTKWNLYFEYLEKQLCLISVWQMRESTWYASFLRYLTIIIRSETFNLWVIMQQSLSSWGKRYCDILVLVMNEGREQ